MATPIPHHSVGPDAGVYDVVVGCDGAALAAAAALCGDVSLDVIDLAVPSWPHRIEALPRGVRALLAVGPAAAPAAVAAAAGMLAARGTVEVLLQGAAPQTAAELTALLQQSADGGPQTSLTPHGILVAAAPAAVTAHPGVAALNGLWRTPSALVLPLRVGFVGDVGLTGLSAGVRGVAVDRELAGDLGELVGGVLDVLVVDRDPAGWSTATVESLVVQARGLGARIVEHAGTGSRRRAWQGAVDLTVGPRLLPGVDLREINPIGFRRSGAKGWAAVGTSRRDTIAQLGEAVGTDAPLDVVDASGPDLVALVRGRVGVVDHAALHPDTATRAQRLVSLAAAGVPVAVLDGADDALGALIGSRLAAAMTAVAPHALAEDPEVRERHSVTLRRIAMDEHTVTGRWRELADQLGIPLRRPPTVSVLLATNRPDFLDHAVQQVNRQTYQPRELIIALHGHRFPPDTAQRLHHTVHGELTVVTCPDHHTLGDVLNTAADAASGDILSKMDDDDWYGAEHLSDLVHALTYSNAHLVGKGAEFVYLADLDLTIRRFTDRAETPSRTMGGGTLTLHRSDLQAAGSWPRVRSGVDQHLIDAMLQAGMALHRTHGYGYVLARRASGHTWAPSVDYFLRQSQAQWRGLALSSAGI